ncbi:MAG: 23S rRNA (adenine(2503)-C(2))-methyltransferase RlmN [Alphaproteobacteria bacterium]|nr:23S rRNA (adenine(2503)-C(2))-methyltransferase RlmN [Alphaproteobacteria bacterium]
MIDLYAQSEADLEALLRSWGEPAFRARQVRAWLYDKGARDVAEMTDLPKVLRERLAAEATLGTLTVVDEQQSADGTRRRLYRLHDGRLVESVLMPYADGRRTACISTQAGCAMGCVFCATGQMGFGRHLSSTEIVEQALRFATELIAVGERLSNVVLMGMGEPFHNYDASVAALRRLQSDLGIGARHLTVSTVGLVPEIRRFAEEGMQVTLAISLHEVEDAARSRLMPINRRWPLAELVEACRHYVDRTGRRITFEWALIAGRNDDEQTAARLGALLRGLSCHVNLIPLNPTGAYDGLPTDPDQVARFVAVLQRHGVPATVRVRRGIDIDAGCGQLTERHLRRAEGEASTPA